MADDNAKVVRFHERMEFQLWEAPGSQAADDGAEDTHNGVRPKRRIKGDHGIVMMREFPGVAAGKVGDGD